MSTCDASADIPLGLIDCHAHLYPPYYPVHDHDDGALAIEEALPAGRDPVCAIVVTEGEGDLRALDRLLTRRPALASRLALCVGVHPVQRSEAAANAVRSVRMTDLACLLDGEEAHIVSHSLVVGIGEIGLDFSPHVLATHPDGPEAARAEQRAVFAAQLALARQWHLPVNVHSRQAGRHALVLLREASYGTCVPPDPGANVLLHAFDGRPRYIQEGLALGAYFSVAPSLARDPLLERLVRLVPLERLVLESDAPALGMVRGEPSAPSQVHWVCQRIAELKGVSLEQAAITTTANARRLFPRLAIRLDAGHTTSTSESIPSFFRLI